MAIGLTIGPIIIITGPVTGPVVGPAAAAAGPALATGAATLAAAGPLGWVALGANENSWDCWRAVLHDYESPEQRGRLLKTVMDDARVIEVRSEEKEGQWPQYWLKNEWNEDIRIDYVLLPGDEIAAHAVRVEQ